MHYTARFGEIAEIGINQNGRCGNRIGIFDAAKNDPVLGFYSTDLSDGHEKSLQALLTRLQRY
jgi:hypothetical protein